MEEFYSFTAHELRGRINKESLSPSDILKSLFNRIEKFDKKIRAFVLLNKDAAPESNANKKGKLYGMPVLVKDNICVKDEDTTCASRILKGFKPPYDATIIKKLKDG